MARVRAVLIALLALFLTLAFTPVVVAEETAPAEDAAAEAAPPAPAEEVGAPAEDEAEPAEQGAGPVAEADAADEGSAGEASVTAPLVDTTDPWFPAAGAPPDLTPSMAWDGMRIVRYLGSADFVEAQPPSNIKSETWIWTGSAWQQVTNDPANPKPHVFAGNHALAPDGSGLVLFGGVSFDALGLVVETWKWNPATMTWSNVTPAVVTESNQPSIRFLGAMAFDGIRTVLYGGIDPVVDPGGPQSGLDDTWLWNGSIWTQICGSSIGNPCPPGPRGGHSLTSDGRGLVLFGGATEFPVDAVPVPLGDTWFWDPLAMVWSLIPTPGPAPRLGQGSAGIPGGAVLFGGAVSDGAGGLKYSDETWMWDASTRTWGQVNISGPSARGLAGMAYDPTRCQVVLFGGSTTIGETGPAGPGGDTWILAEDLDGDGVPDGCPPAAAGEVAALPFTGADSGTPMGLGAGLIMVGLAMLLLERRVRRARRETAA